MDLLGGLGTGTTLLGELMGGFGKFQAGQGSQMVNELNAAVSRANAAAIRQSGEFDIARLGKAKARFKSGQHAGYAKAGVRSEGSPIEVMIDSAAQWETDILIAKYNTKVDEIGANLQSSLSKAQGKIAAAQGLGALGGTLLSTAGSFAGLGSKK